MKTSVVRLILRCSVLITGALIIPPSSYAGFPLPDSSEVAPTEQMAIDGIWRITANNSRMKIEKGRGIAVDSWKVVFKGVVEPDKVALQNIVYLGQGEFRGEDLTLSGKFSAKIQPNGDLKFQVGLIPYVLTPIELDDPIEYIGMMTQAGLDAKDSPYLSNWILAEKAKRDAREEIGGGEPTAPGEEIVGPGEEPPAPGDGDPGPPGDGGIDPGPGEDIEPIEPGPGEDIGIEPEPIEEIEPEPIEEIGEEPDPEFIGEDQEFVEEDPDNPKLQKFEATVHGEVGKKKRTCKGRNVYLSQGACYRCPKNYKRASLTRKMDHPQACQKRGLPQHNYTSAKYIGKARPIAGCPGKNVYRSSGGCYACPNGYKRASATRKMTHSKACQERGAPKHKYTRARKLYELDAGLLPCPKGQFAHQGYCKSCPTGTLRVQLLALDTGYCLKKE